MTIEALVGIAVGTSSLITFIGTKLWDAYAMAKRYRLKSEAERCMEQRKDAETKIQKQLKLQEKRLMLSNLIMARLCKELKVPDADIAAMEKAIGININDK